MKSGLLTGKMTRERVAALPEDDFRRRAPAFQEPQLSKNLALADLMQAIGARHGRSAGEVAIAWTLRHPAVTAAIVGMRSAAQANGVVSVVARRNRRDRQRALSSGTGARLCYTVVVLPGKSGLPHVP
jgi:aryl-alcohol dehydrogenase-like predicted oxidoreductase